VTHQVVREAAVVRHKQSGLHCQVTEALQELLAGLGHLRVVQDLLQKEESPDTFL